MEISYNHENDPEEIRESDQDLNVTGMDYEGF